MSEFDDLYQSSYPRLAQQLNAYLGDRAEAEDVAQEAYLRLWQRWDKVSGYDDPVAWVRRVAWNLATSRWRRLAVTTRYRWWASVPPSPVDLSPDRVALVAALRDLPETHRRAVVLHYIGDLPVEEVAQELGVPRGTVLSWLHRSRQRLADLLADEAARRAPAAPDAAGIVVRARRKARTRLVAVIAAMLTGATAAAAVLVPVINGIPAPAQRMDHVLWTQGSITLPDQAPPDSGCPTGRQRMQPLAALRPSTPANVGLVDAGSSGSGMPLELRIDGEHPLFGDLTGDGVAEAVLPVQCGGGELDPDGYGSRFLLVVTRRGGTLQALGYIGQSLLYGRSKAIEITAGRLVTRFQVVRPGGTGETWIVSPTQQRVYEWTGDHLVQVAGPNRALFIGAGSPHDSPIDATSVRDLVPGICWPRVGDPGAAASARPHTFHASPTSAAEIDLDGDGTAELLVGVVCDAGNTNAPNLFLLRQARDHFDVLDVPLRNGDGYQVTTWPVVSGLSFTMTLREIATGRTRQVTMTWDGARFGPKL